MMFEFEFALRANGDILDVLDMLLGYGPLEFRQVCVVVVIVLLLKYFRQ